MEHSASMYANMERYKEGVMCDEELSDMQKLQMVFSASKGSLKGRDPQLYYAILGVLDHEKRGAKQIHFRRNDHGFLLREDWNTIVSACKVVGDAIWDTPSCGMTDENGNDYMPADIMYSPEEIQEALKVVNAYFGR